MLRRLTLVLHATLIGICRALRLGPLRLWMRENVPAHREWDGHPVSDATLLHPNTDFAHKHWERVLNCSTVPRLVIDATCGNGHDSLVLVKALISAGGGRLICCDIQQTSIDRSRKRMQEALQVDKGLLQAAEWNLTSQSTRVSWHQGDHCTLLKDLDEGQATLVVFNCGYLPGGDKTIVTTAESTVRALIEAERVLMPSGVISVALYPGHEEGRREEERVLDHARVLDQGRWSVYYTQWLNQRSKKSGVRAPSVVLLQKIHV